MQHKAVITGMGVVSRMGDSLEATKSSLQANNPNSIEQVSRPQAGGQLVNGLLAAPGDFRPHPELDPSALHGLPHDCKMAISATQQAITQAGLSHDLVRSATVVQGSSNAGWQALEAGYHRIYGLGKATVHPLTILRAMSSAQAAEISRYYGTEGPCFNISSACASSTNAIGEAARQISSGHAELVITGGAEASFYPGPWAAWSAVHVLSETGCRPFCASRDGTVLGEGAGSLVVESARHAESRGATSIAEIVGYGMSTDPGSQVRPACNSMERAIRLALQGRANPPGFTLVSTHGTGTRLNDCAEAAAMQAVFGQGSEDWIAIATKPLHGHLIGASGIVELIVALLSAELSISPSIPEFEAMDPECHLNLAWHQQPVPRVDYVLSNSIAFGGHNASLLVKLDWE